MSSRTSSLTEFSHNNIMFQNICNIACILDLQIKWCIVALHCDFIVKLNDKLFPPFLLPRWSWLVVGGWGGVGIWWVHMLYNLSMITLIACPAHDVIWSLVNLHGVKQYCMLTGEGSHVVCMHYRMSRHRPSDRTTSVYISISGPNGCTHPVD